MSDQLAPTMREGSSAAEGHIDPRDPANYCIHIAPDWGTSTFSGGYQFVLNGCEPSADETHILQLEEGRDEIPQMAAIVCNQDRTWRLIWRNELKAVLTSGQHHANLFIFERLKMCLYPSSVRDEVRKDTQQKLDQAATLCDNSSGWTIEWLITQFLNVMREAYGTALINAAASRWSREQLARMKVHTFFPVPELTTFATRKVFQDMIRDAGFKNGTCVTETEAAAAWRVHDLSRDWRKHPYLTSGAKVVVADGGGLTLNAARYTISDSAEAGAAVKMDPDGSPMGTDCGSELLTMKCQTHVRAGARGRFGSLDACLERLGLSKEEFDRGVAGQFEAMKKAYPDVAPSWISVEGVSRDGVVAETLDVKISRDLLTVWFEETLDKIVSILSQLIDEKTSMLLFTGGLFRSHYLVDNLKAIYREQGVHVPDSGTQQSNASDTSVVKGTLARFIVRPVQRDPTLCLGIIEKSPYEPDVHIDIPPEELRAAESGTPSARIAKLGRELYALDRFRTILAPDAFVGSRTLDEAVGVWQEFAVTTEQPTLETVVYKSSVSNHDNAPIFKANGEYQDGVEVYMEVKRTIDEETMARYYYRLPNGRAGLRHYRVIARLRATGTWPDVALEWVLGPGRNGRIAQVDYDSARLAAMPADRFTQLGADELHNGLFPATMQRNRHDTSPAH